MYWGPYWNLVLVCSWLHPTQWPVYSTWPAPRMLATCQCKHRAPAGSNTGLWREHRALKLRSWCSAGMAHTESTLSLLKFNLHGCGMLCTYVHLRIDIGLSTPLLRDEHNSHANSMQQMLRNSSENKLVFFAPQSHDARIVLSLT